MTARRKRGTAFVILDEHEAIVTLFALKTFREMQKRHPAINPNEERKEMEEVTQALHDRIDKRTKPLRGKR